MKKKEKREAVLYVTIKPSLKRFLKKKSKELNYPTLSEFVDAVLTEYKGKSK